MDIGEVSLIFSAQEAGAPRLRRGVPAGRVHLPDLRPTDPTRRLRGFATRRSVDESGNFVQATRDAVPGPNPARELPNIAANFCSNRFYRFARVPLIAPVLHYLLEAEGDKHAHNDNSDLAYKFTPAVKRLRKMNVHAAMRRGQI